MEKESAMFVGCSSAHRTLLERLSKVASTDAEVLLTGATGVGKELYASYIHAQSLRKSAPFVPVNCGTLGEDLLGNELFGHSRGAYTGAIEGKDGLIGAAEAGTLFLDEIDAVDLPSQVKLLRFLQDKKYRRIGETNLRTANLRVISATNRDLDAAVQDGCFRSDLYFRLRVFPVHIPPLCTRPDDIRMLTMHFVREVAEDYNMKPVTFTRQAIDRLLSYSWPGNIRELLNCIRYLTLLQPGQPVQPDELPLLCWNDNEQPSADAAVNRFDFGRPLKEAKRDLVAEFERRYLDKALRRSHGNVSLAARNSGKPRRVFFELMRRYNIDAREYRAG